jgi:hypothetical protein
MKKVILQEETPPVTGAFSVLPYQFYQTGNTFFTAEVAICS